MSGAGLNRRTLPPRVARRPDVADWNPLELLTLEEAAALHFPSGLLSASSLKNAAKAGQLDVVVVARKRLTCGAAIERMSSCGPKPERAAPVGSDAALSEPIRRSLGRMCGPRRS